MDQSIDKTITAVVGYCKSILRVEQKKNDFMSEDLSSLNQGCTHACRKVVDYLTRCIGQMKGALDGENIEIILAEFGSRFHGLIFEHLQQFQYSSMGGMLVICDIKVIVCLCCLCYIGYLTVNTLLPLLAPLFCCICHLWWQFLSFLSVCRKNMPENFKMTKHTTILGVSHCGENVERDWCRQRVRYTTRVVQSVTGSAGESATSVHRKHAFHTHTLTRLVNVLIWHFIWHIWIDALTNRTSASSPYLILVLNVLESGEWFRIEFVCVCWCV